MLRLTSSILKRNYNSLSSEKIQLTPASFYPTSLTQKPATFYQHIVPPSQRFDIQADTTCKFLYNVVDIQKFDTPNKWTIITENNGTFQYHIYKGPTIDFKFDKHRTFLGLGPPENQHHLNNSIRTNKRPKIYNRTQICEELKKPENKGFCNWKNNSLGMVRSSAHVHFQNHLTPVMDKDQIIDFAGMFDLDEFGFKSKRSNNIFHPWCKHRQKIVSFELFERRKKLLLNPMVNTSQAPKLKTYNLNDVKDESLRKYLAYRTRKLEQKSSPILKCYSLNPFKVIVTPEYSKVSAQDRKKLLNIYRVTGNLIFNNLVIDLAFVSFVPLEINGKTVIIDSERNNLENLFLSKSHHQLTNRKIKGRIKFKFDNIQLNNYALINNTGSSDEKYISWHEKKFNGKIFKRYFRKRLIKYPPMNILLRDQETRNTNLFWYDNGVKKFVKKSVTRRGAVTLEITRSYPTISKHIDDFSKFYKVPFSWYSPGRLYTNGYLLGLNNNYKTKSTLNPYHQVSRLSLKTKALKKYCRRFEKNIPNMILRNGQMSNKNTKRKIYDKYEDHELLGSLQQPDFSSSDYKLVNFNTPSMPRAQTNFKHAISSPAYEMEKNDITNFRLAYRHFEILRCILKENLYVYGQMPNSDRLPLNYLVNQDEFRTYQLIRKEVFNYLDEELWCGHYIEKTADKNVKMKIPLSDKNEKRSSKKDQAVEIEKMGSYIENLLPGSV